METRTQSVYWEAPEHAHFEKTSDWYWILGIVAVAGSVAAIIMGNALFGMVILLGAVTMMIVAGRHPRIIPFEVSGRGIRIDTDLFPYATLDAFYLDEENEIDPQLIVRSKKLLGPLLVIPVPHEYARDIDRIVAERLPEEYMKEPIAHKILDFFGF